MTSRPWPAIGLAIFAWIAWAPPPASAQETPTPLLPPVLGQQPVIGDPGARPITGPSPAGPVSGPDGALPAGSLGTIPLTALPGPTGEDLGAVLARFDGPMPAASLTPVVRTLILDPSVAGLSGAADRARAFYGLGLLEDAAGAAVEAPTTTVADRALTARALLALGREVQACERADVDRLPSDAEPGPTFELLEILALCKLAQGAGDAAGQIVGLLREQRGSDDLFHAAFKMAAGGRGSLPTLSRVKRVRPIHLALLQRAGQPLTPGLAGRADLALTPYIAREQRFAHDVRIAAAERAVAAGLMAADSLFELYVTTSLDEALLRKATSGQPPEGPLARAHLFALVAEAPTETERMGFIASAYRQGVGAGVGAALAEVLGEDLAGVVATPELGRWARMAVEILIRADRLRAALAWIDAAELPGADGKAAFSRMDSHVARALLAVAAPELGFGVAAGALGSDAGGTRLNAKERRFIDRETAIMTALGDPVPRVLAEIARNSTEPVQTGGGPAAVLGAFAPLAGLSWEKADDAAVARALAALVSAGSVFEARRAGVEALAAAAPG